MLTLSNLQHEKSVSEYPIEFNETPIGYHSPNIDTPLQVF